MAVSFRGDPFHAGFHAPLRFEADIHDCETEGRIPDDLDGSFYRTCIDRRYPQRAPNDIPYNADGMVDLFRFRGGHVDFRTRYLRTPRYVAERAARRALFGVYRNRYTDDPSVAGVSANTGNRRGTSLRRLPGIRIRTLASAARPWAARKRAASPWSAPDSSTG